MTIRNKLVAAGLTASLLGGAGAVAVHEPASALAQGAATTAAGARATPAWIAGALDKLVGAGTIDRGQADAVRQALAEAAPEHRPGHGRGGAGHLKGLEAAAGAIGVSPDDLRTALRSGQSLAQVAAANGVERQAVVDALVAEANGRIDQAVTDGRLTAEEAAAKKATVAERVAERVDTAGLGDHRRGRHHVGDDNGTTTAPPETTTSTTAA